jgi:hypothetical protein
MGQNKYGHKKIAYDEERHMFVCAKAHKKKNTDYDQDGEDEIGTFNIYSQNRKNRKDAREKKNIFKHIPCKNQPVIRINLKGHRLYYKGACYLHCPKCASFHKYSPENWAAAPHGKYRCKECVEKDLKPTHLACAYCKTRIRTGNAKLKTMYVVDDINLELRNVYFCQRHWKIAMRYEKLNIPLKELLKKIRDGVDFQNRRTASTIY